MDFMNRGIHQPPQTNNNNSDNLATPERPAPAKKVSRLNKIRNHKVLNIVYITLLFSITILIVSVVSSIFLFDGDGDKESKFVDKGKYQAVFLNGGQVYFGKVSELTGKYLTLGDIYYLTPSQDVQADNSANKSPQNFTIKKLGCELHRPQDIMVINRDQIVFWENLKDDSSENTVPGAIKKLKDSNPNGQCQTNNSSNATDNNNANTNNNNATNNNNSPSTGTSNNNNNSSSTPPTNNPASNQ